VQVGTWANGEHQNISVRHAGLLPLHPGVGPGRVLGGERVRRGGRGQRTGPARGHALSQGSSFNALKVLHALGASTVNAYVYESRCFRSSDSASRCDGVSIGRRRAGRRLHVQSLSLGSPLTKCGAPPKLPFHGFVLMRSVSLFAPATQAA